MQLNLTGHHVDITDAMRNYVDSRFERLARHFDHVLDAHVVLSVEKLRHKAEATIQVNGAAASSGNGEVTQVAFHSLEGLIGVDPSAPYSVVWSNAPLGSNRLFAVMTDSTSQVVCHCAGKKGVSAGSRKTMESSPVR